MSLLPRRPLVSRRALGPWLVLLATLPLGFRSFYRNSHIGPFNWDPAFRMGVNYRTYHHAAQRAQAGMDFYDVPPPGTYDWAVYLYPPGTVFSYYPFTLLQWETGFAVLTVLSLMAAVAATWLLVRYVETLGVELGWVDIVLVLAAFVVSTHAYGTLYFGNINLLMALGFVVGFWALLFDREYLSGSVFGLAALFKLFPAVVGLWFLRRRSWHAVGAALAVGIGGLLVGLVAFGVDTTHYYLTEVMVGRTETDQFVGGYPVDGTYYVTIQQPISHLVSTLWSDAPYWTIFGTSALLYLGVLAYFYRDIETELDRQMALLATVIVAVTIVPSLRWYLILVYPPLVAVLYLWTEGWARLPFLLGGALMSVTTNAAEAAEFVGERLPWLLGDIGSQYAGAAVPPMYGLLLMLAACAWHKYRTDAVESSEDGIPQRRPVDL